MSKVKLYHGTYLYNGISIIKDGKIVPGNLDTGTGINFDGDEEEFDRNVEILKKHVFFGTDFNMVLEYYACGNQDVPCCIISIEVDEDLLKPDLIDAPQCITWVESSDYCKQIMIEGEILLDSNIEVWVVKESNKPVKLDIESLYQPQ